MDYQTGYISALTLSAENNDYDIFIAIHQTIGGIITIDNINDLFVKACISQSDKIVDYILENYGRKIIITNEIFIHVFNDSIRHKLVSQEHDNNKLDYNKLFFDAFINGDSELCMFLSGFNCYGTFLIDINNLKELTSNNVKMSNEFISYFKTRILSRENRYYQDSKLLEWINSIDK